MAEAQDSPSMHFCMITRAKNDDFSDLTGENSVWFMEILLVYSPLPTELNHCGCVE